MEETSMNMRTLMVQVLTFSVCAVAGCGQGGDTTLRRADLHSQIHPITVHRIAQSKETSVKRGLRLHRSALMGLNLHSETFRSDLLDGKMRTFAVNRIRNITRSGYSWFGKVDNNPLNYFSVTFLDGSAVGSARVEGHSYLIRTDADGNLLLIETEEDMVECETNPHQNEIAEQ